MDPISNKLIDGSVKRRNRGLARKNRLQRSFIQWFSGGLTAALIASGVAAIKAEASKSTGVQESSTNLKLDGTSPKQGSTPSLLGHPPYKMSDSSPSLTAQQKQIVGTWRLVSWENRDEQGKVTYPYGKDALGYLVYNADGYMCATLSKKDRPNFPGGDILAGTLEEQAKAVQTYIAYCGKYQVQPDKVVHLPDVSLFPNYIGTKQERLFKLEKGQLILTHAPELMDGKKQTPFLIWERASK
ncbi:cylclase [Nostocales cyanobacterium HT-58-2]|nr:cylclase [Nostocales cyanobacterium HT-58-2]